MSRFTLLLLCAFAFLGMSNLNAQVLFYEDFDGIGGPTAGGAGTYTFPSGWFLRNVDNRTPAGSVSYVNEAWERREDFAFNVGDSAAFSTSWYSPAGAADDWMWTPLIGPLPANANLSWNAITYDVSYPDGYEVRIMTSTQGPPTGGTGALGNQVSNSTQVFTIAAENTAWTARNLSLNSYAGQSVYVGFRNTSNDKFILLIDDVQVEVLNPFNAVVSAPDTMEYTLTPERQQQGLPFDATITNSGTNALTNVFLSVEVRNAGGALVHSGNSATVASIAPAASANFSVANVNNYTPEDYTITYTAHHSNVDNVPANDTLRQDFTITSATYARDNGNVVGALGIGAGNGGYLGQDFEFVQSDIIDTVLVFMNRGYTGRNLSASIWSMVNDTPSAIIGATDTVQYIDDSARVYMLPIAGGGLGLNPGTYTIALYEWDSTLSLGNTSAIFTNGTVWVDWPTSPLGGWGNVEAFGASFSRSLVLRPDLIYNTFSVDSSNFTNVNCGLNDGSAAVFVSGDQMQGVQYLWSNGATTSAITNLAAGTYSVTVSAFGVWSETVNFNITNNAGINFDSLTTQNALCAGGQGSAQVFASGGTTPYTYLWSNGATTSTISAGVGSYTVTITDGSGCTTSGGPATISAPSAVTGTMSETGELAGLNDGTATVAASGGTAPYTYLWNNGGTTSTITGLAGGITYTVTVTDANGCTFTDSILVSLIIGIEDQLNLNVTLSPNPNPGIFRVSGSMASAEAVSITVFDPAGKQVYSSTLAPQAQFEHDVRLTNVANGRYILRVGAGGVIRELGVVVQR